MPAQELTTSTGLTGFKQLLGIESVDHQEGYAVLALTVTAEHLNSHGSLHGGVLATLIDHAGGNAGCIDGTNSKSRNAVTLSLTTSFLAPVSSGKIFATARKRPGGRRIFVSTTEITDESGRLLAVGEATYRYIDL